MGEVALQDEYGPFTMNDVIKIAPTDEERVVLVERMRVQREREAQRKLEKKARKEKRKRAEAAASSSSSPVVDAAFDARAAAEPEPSTSSSRVAKKAKSTTSMDGAHASRAAEILNEVKKQQAASKAAADGGGVYKSLFKGTGSQKPKSATAQFILSGGARYNLS